MYVFKIQQPDRQDTYLYVTDLLQFELKKVFGGKNNNRKQNLKTLQLLAEYKK